MDPYKYQDTYRLLAGQILARLGSSQNDNPCAPPNPSDLPVEYNNRNNFNPQLQPKSIGDYNATNAVLNSNPNASYISSSSSSAHNHSHDSSLGNSPGSATDNSGSFTAATPAGMITSAMNMSQRSSGVFSSSTPPIGDGQLLQPAQNGGRIGARRLGKGSGAQCPECNKRFNNSSALAKHKLIHAPDRRHTCPKCGKGFKRQDHLSGHMMTHEEQKPYKCYIEGCDKSYCDSRSLRRHLENHHGVHIESPFICPPDYQPANKSSAKNQFFSYDDDRVRQLAELNNAQNRPGQNRSFSPITPAPTSPPRRPTVPSTGSQNGINIVQCTLCSKKFRSLASLNGHMRIHGPRRSAVGATIKEEESSSMAGSRTQSPAGSRSLAGDSMDKHPLQSTSSCVFTPGPLSAQNQHMMMRQAQASNPDNFMGSSVPERSSLNSELPQPQIAHTLRQPPSSLASQPLPPSAHSGPLDLAFSQQQNLEDFQSRMGYQPMASSVPTSSLNAVSNSQPQATASILASMMKAAFPVDQDPVWLQSLYNPESSSFMAQVYQQQQQVSHLAPQQHQPQARLPSAVQPSVASYQMQQSQSKFTVPQSPRSILRSSFVFPPPIRDIQSTWPGFPGSNNCLRQPPPQMKDIATSPFVTIPKERQVFFPPDGDDQNSTCLSTQPQCSPSTPGTISVVGDHPPLSAGPLSAGYISVVGTPPQKSPAIMYGTPGSSSSGAAAANSSASSEHLQPCRITPCPPSPVTINSGATNSTHPSGLLMRAPSPNHNKGSQSNKSPRMLPPIGLPPAPKSRKITPEAGETGNQSREQFTENTDHLSDLDSSPELFDEGEIDPHLYLRSPPQTAPQTAPPVLFGASGLDPKKFNHFSFDDCDLDAAKGQDRDIELRTPSPVPDEELEARPPGPLPSPGIVFKSPGQTKVPKHVNFALTPPGAQVIPQSQAVRPQSVDIQKPAEVVSNTPPKSSLASSDSVPNTSKRAPKRSRPPPLPIMDSNYGPVSQLRTYVDAINSATSSVGTLSSAASSSSAFSCNFAGIPGLIVDSKKEIHIDLNKEIPPYTPPPILSPFRGTPGTFWALKNPDDSATLNASSASSVFFKSTAGNGEITPLSDRKPRINVGSSFQVEIPPYRKSSLALREADKGEVMFHPSCLAHVSNDQINALSELAKSSAAGSPHGSNVELVMHLLNASGGSIEKVTSVLLNAGKNNRQALPPAIARYRYQENVVWNAEEIKLFISAVGQFKKDFYQISKAMKTKSVKECIEFYYLWKRLFSELSANGEPAAKKQCMVAPISLSTSTTGNGRVPLHLGDQSVASNKQNIYFCDHCPKVFDKKRAKSFHMKVYHSSHSSASSTNIAASLLASSKPTSTCYQLIFASASSPTVPQQAQLAQ